MCSDNKRKKNGSKINRYSSYQTNNTPVLPALQPQNPILLHSGGDTSHVVMQNSSSLSVSAYKHSLTCGKSKGSFKSRPILNSNLLSHGSDRYIGQQFDNTRRSVHHF